MFTDFNGKELDAKDVLGKLKRIPPQSFDKLGPASYPAKMHSHSGTRTTANGAKIRVLNAVINEKGLVSFVGDPDDKFTNNQDVVLEFVENVESNGRTYSRFNALFELPTS